MLALALVHFFGTEDGLLALGGIGVEAELQLLQLAVGQREAIDGTSLADRQQFLVGDEDTIVPLAWNGENATTEEVAAGMFEQGRIDLSADGILVGFEGLLLADDARFLEAAPVVAVDVPDELLRFEASEGLLRQGAAAASEARRHSLARLTEEHGEVAGRGAARQRILEGAFELAIVRIAED